MGWCYTFGVECSPGCKHPMLVRESLDACECAACGFVCGGRFANCSRVIFSTAGRSVQLRSLPRSAPWVNENADPDPLLPASEDGGNERPTPVPETGSGFLSAEAAEELAMLREQVFEIRNELTYVSNQLSELRLQLGAVASPGYATHSQALASSITNSSGNSNHREEGNGNGHRKIPAATTRPERSESDFYRTADNVDGIAEPLRPRPAVAHPQTIARITDQTTG